MEALHQELRVVDSVEEAFAAAATGERVLLQRGEERVAVVPVEDVALLAADDQAEDEWLNAAADAAVRELEESGEELVPWDEVKRRAGLA